MTHFLTLSSKSSIPYKLEIASRAKFSNLTRSSGNWDARSWSLRSRMLIRNAPSPTEGSRTVVEYWTIDSFNPGRETMASTISLGVNTSPCCWTRFLLLIKTSFSANILTHFRITEIAKYSAKQCLLIFNYTCQSSRLPSPTQRAKYCNTWLLVEAAWKIKVIVVCFTTVGRPLQRFFYWFTWLVSEHFSTEFQSSK